jgi:ATPase family AAA domain-containing protein 3A/B
MSWIFGVNKPQNVPDLSSLGLPLPPPDDGGKGSGGAGGGGNGSDKSTMDSYRFDSAALERAAKAAKDLEKSRTF